jgi:hypothetical protein
VHHEGRTPRDPRTEGDLSGGWASPRIADYWDPWGGAIDAAGLRLSTLGSDEVQAATAQIADAMGSHVDFFDDGALLDAALVVADDLYKSACAIDRWDDSLETYLAASAGTFFRLLGERGFTVQYLVDNQWADLARPQTLFPHWYRAAGLTYVCPQAIMAMLPEYKLIGEADGYEAATGAVINEARDVADKIVRGCQERNEHFIQLDCDWVEQSFALAEQRRGDSSVLTVLRNLSPERDTRVEVTYPEGLAPADRDDSS